MNAVGWIEADAPAVGRGRVFQHFVDVRGAEVLARVAEFLYAALIADVGVVDDEVRGLIFFVLRA